MGRRSRKQSLTEPSAQPAPKQRLSGAERDEIARAELRPLAPDERPLPVKIAAFLAAALAIANVAFYKIFFFTTYALLLVVFLGLLLILGARN